MTHPEMNEKDLDIVKVYVRTLSRTELRGLMEIAFIERIPLEFVILSHKMIQEKK